MIDVDAFRRAGRTHPMSQLSHHWSASEPNDLRSRVVLASMSVIDVEMIASGARHGTEVTGVAPSAAEDNEWALPAGAVPWRHSSANARQFRR
jgi:hypothetical protein